MSLISSINSASASGSWAVKGATEDDGAETPGLSLTWNSLAPGQLKSQWLVAIHPDFGSYDPQIGLVLGLSAPEPKLEYVESAPALRYQYQFEPWATHAERVVVQAQRMQPAYRRTVGKLAHHYNLRSSEIEELVELVCLLHDVGKLSDGWQKTAWRWQIDKDQRMRNLGHFVPPRQPVPLAHTWFDSQTDRALQSRPEYRFPPHAVEGAYAVAIALDKLLSDKNINEAQDVAAVCFTCIARHHGARSRELKPFQLHSEAESTVQSVLPASASLFALTPRQPGDTTNFAEHLLAFVREADEPLWPLYVFLVRRLRLADQGSLRNASERDDSIR